MRNFLVIFSFVFLTLHLSGFSQTIVKTDSAAYEKAKYLKEDLTTFLSNSTRYPRGLMGENSQGDVIYSFVINKDGQLENLLLESSPDNILSVSTYEALQKMENKWSPTKLNNVAIDRKYTVVFRYRSYLNTKPTEYKSGIASYVKKQKYDKAIKLYDEQISENQYDCELFAERAKLKELVGDKAGAIQDNKIADKLNVDIMAVVNLLMVGFIRVVKTVGNPERVIR